MNTPVRRLATVMLVMFLALMASATWVQFVQAPDLNSDSRNVRTLYREFGTDRGPIVVGGEAVALSEEVNDSFGFQRRYPFGELYAPVTGFYSVVYRQTGLEYTETSCSTAPPTRCSCPGCRTWSPDASRRAARWS